MPKQTVYQNPPSFLVTTKALKTIVAFVTKGDSLWKHQRLLACDVGRPREFCKMCIFKCEMCGPEKKGSL